MIELFVEDPHHPALRNHPLTPPLARYSSISIDADLRILYRMIDPDTAVFLKIGDHDTVYVE
jgi:mRNA-degrading endonuclease YafQ of YafQ-DinJ toxin-antitoxin module